MAFDFDPSRAAEYTIEIPIKSVKGIKYLTEKPISGGDTVMLIDIIPDFMVKHSGMLLQSDVEKDYVSKIQLKEILMARCKNMREQMANHGAKGRYYDAQRLKNQVDAIEVMISELRDRGRIERDAR
jgi:hypothetical protein